LASIERTKRKIVETVRYEFVAERLAGSRVMNQDWLIPVGARTRV